MNQTVSLADLMRRMGIPFDVNPFVSMYLNDMMNKRRRPPGAPGMGGQMPPTGQPEMMPPGAGPMGMGPPGFTGMRPEWMMAMRERMGNQMGQQTGNAGQMAQGAPMARMGQAMGLSGLGNLWRR